MVSDNTWLDCPRGHIYPFDRLTFVIIYFPFYQFFFLFFFASV